MRRAWRNLVREWRLFREALHGEIVFRRHRKGRCTWIEEPSHGSFRWRKCEYTFCDKREYMADTSARWAPVPTEQPVQFRTRMWANLGGTVGGYPVYRPVHHLDGHQIIGQDLVAMFTDTYIEGDIIPERPAA